MTKDETGALKALCARLRRELIETLYPIQSGHPGGSLSACEILATLYFHTANTDPRDENRDPIILSKGHAAPMLYLCLAHKGYIPMEELATLRQLDSRLQGHPSRSKTPGVEISTGPLGLGLSAGNGMAAAARLGGHDYNVYVILGDGELQEGAIWEAAMTAAKFGLSNMTAIVDNNGVQLDGTNREIMPLGDIGAKFAAFGWHVLRADGHDVASLAQAYDEAKAYRQGPVVIIADTIKGKGVSFMEGKSIWHGKPISGEEYAAALAELGGEGA